MRLGLPRRTFTDASAISTYPECTVICLVAAADKEFLRAADAVKAGKVRMLAAVEREANVASTFYH